MTTKIKRSCNSSIFPIINFLYEVLLLVENDEHNLNKGCNWNHVKANVTKSSISDEIKGVSRIKSEGNYILDLSKHGSLGSRFLIAIRDAFAHNYMSYDNTNNILTITLCSKNKKNGIRKELVGDIKLYALEEIVNLIKESYKLKQTK